MNTKKTLEERFFEKYPDINVFTDLVNCKIDKKMYFLSLQKISECKEQKKDPIKYFLLFLNSIGYKVFIRKNTENVEETRNQIEKVFQREYELSSLYVSV